MKCKKCGAEISEGAKFCENCGARVEAEVNETPVASEEITVGAVGEAATATSFAAEKEPFSPIPEEPAKKKKHVWAKAAAGLICVVAILAVLACCSKVVGNTFRKWFLSPEKYLAYVLKDNFGKAVDDSLTIYDEYRNRAQTPDNVEGNVKFEIALGDEFSDYISEYASGITPNAEWVTWVKKASIEYGVTSFENEYGLRAKIGANDVNLVSLSASYNPEGELYIAVPELLNKTIYFQHDQETTDEIFKMKNMMNSIYKEFPTKPELQSISKKYLKAVFDNVKGVKRTNGVISVEDISAKATVLSMELDDVLLTNIEVDVLEEFLEDTEFEKIWTRVYGAYEEVISDTGNNLTGTVETYDEIKKNAEEALNKAKEKLESYKNDQLQNSVKATITFYVDNKGTLSGCSITNDESEYSFIHPAKSGRFGIETVMKGLDTNGDFDNLTITGTGKESESIITADLTAFVDDEKMFDIVINNIDKSIGQKGEGSFDIAITNVNFDETSDSDLEVLKEIIGDTNVGFYYKGTVSKNNAEATMDLGNGEKNLFSVKVVSEIKDGSKVNVEGKDEAIKFDANDESVLVDVIKAIDGETFANNLREAGANEKLVSTVEIGIAYLKSLAAYY